MADDGAVGLGGTCVNVGCVPKKLMVYGSEFGRAAKEGKAFGWDTKQGEAVWSRLIKNKNKEISRLNKVYEDKVLVPAGVKVIKSRAQLIDAHTIQLDTKETCTADKILISVGGWPRQLKFPGSEHLITSNEVFFLKERPKRVVIIGVGYIGVEFAGIFEGYGSDVTLIMRGELILRAFDKDCRTFLQNEMVKSGIKMEKKTEISKIVKQSDGSFQVTLNNGKVLMADVVMAAAGRLPKTEGLGLEKAGVELDKRGFIKVNEWQQTNIPNIFSVGDCTPTLQLTPVALHEGHCFADTQFGGKVRRADREYVATAVFANPNLGTCGLTEDQALKEYGGIKVFTSKFLPLKNRVSGATDESFMKIIVATHSDKVVGMHMVGHGAGEIMQGFSTAMRMGMTKKQLDSTIGIHPTSAEEFVTMRTEKYEVKEPPTKKSKM
uniref:Glutathione-disulfide reductase n=1 Tax=Amorphochlora amoebiformis TaxID=1561963 RepID=A0A7S0H812_9EUKA